MGLDVEDVEACLMFMSARGTSLDAPLSDDGGTIATVIGDGKMGQDVRLERTANSEAILVAVSGFVDTLNDRQRAIFTGRVVNELIGNDKQCAMTFGVTKQRVGQIEKDLRGKLARHFTATFGTSGVGDMLRASF